MPSATASREEVLAPPPAEPSQLPDGSAPELKLVLATPKEAREASVLNGLMWSGPLALPAYLRREEHLAQSALAREGGLTVFVLVDSTKPEGKRDILSACETIRKRALVVESNGAVEEVISHAIGSVFCRAEYRGRGYAQRMIQELRKVLEQWQQEPGEKARFNVLYSDIGKKFYAKEGWLPFPSSHVRLPPMRSMQNSPAFPPTVPLHSEDLADLCQVDVRMLRTGLARFGAESSKTRVAMVPEVEVMQWHHARENFLASELFGKAPTVKGVRVNGVNGEARAWIIWTRTFQRKAEENTLHILRIVIADEDCYMELDKDAGVPAEHVNGLSSNGHSNGRLNSNHIAGSDLSALQRTQTNSETRLDHARAVAACLQAAQAEASKWNMAQVDVWNPSPTVLAAARLCEADVEIQHRDTESIASLLWYGPKNPDDVEWVCNEKFGWC